MPTSMYDVSFVNVLMKFILNAMPYFMAHCPLLSEKRKIVGHNFLKGKTVILGNGLVILMPGKYRQ